MTHALEKAKPTQETNPSSHQRGCCMKTVTARVQLKKNPVDEPQGVCNGEELIGSKHQ
jgi:hypothetical protein